MTRTLAHLGLASSLVACNPIGRGALVQGPETLTVQRGPSVSEALADAVDADVLAVLERWGKPGASVAVFDDEGVLYSAGYGLADLETRREMGPDTPVLLSSISKTVVGVAAMQGVEAGRLTLDDPVGPLVGFTLDNPKVEGETIRLHHLLTHTSGARDSLIYALAYAEGDPVVSLRDFSEGYFTRGGAHWSPANYARSLPGDTLAYSNTGAALAGLAVGSAAELEFDDLVRRDILEPLGMGDSAYFLADLESPPATCYQTRKNGFRPWNDYGYPTYPDGLMRASARDLGRFGAAILGEGELDDERILTAESVERMLAPWVGLPDGLPEGESQAVMWFRFGLGDRDVVGHNGGDYGSFTELWLDDDEDVGMLILFHTTPQSVDEYDDIVELELRLLDLAEGVSP